MKIETRNNGVRDITVIIADEGKVFIRKGNENYIYGNEIWLGQSWYINGVKLDEPHLDVPDDFEEINEPNEE